MDTAAKAGIDAGNKMIGNKIASKITSLGKTKSKEK